jgi:hypothetical protein
MVRCDSGTWTAICAVLAVALVGCTAEVPNAEVSNDGWESTSEELRRDGPWDEDEAASLETAGKVLLSLTAEEMELAQKLERCDPTYAADLLSYADQSSSVAPEPLECAGGDLPEPSSLRESCAQRIRSFIRFWSTRDWAPVAACYACPACCVLAVCVLT